MFNIQQIFSRTHGKYDMVTIRLVQHISYVLTLFALNVCAFMFICLQPVSTKIGATNASIGKINLVALPQRK